MRRSVAVRTLLSAIGVYAAAALTFRAGLLLLTADCGDLREQIAYPYGDPVLH
jgi:hypothetical protein